ncbi:MAG: inositol monophosphatase [Saprospiraceae bacterium]|jgi:myo-inositol-1(or 4)-monophosphatase|nr:inositol monophosphatase [Saprospiraceae bacterium]MDP4822146.1 inositol monophosphatase [Saprospiraceae bacterium]MDP4998977.1 inositol monophosphatase [Saprospiraceae bacterium]
MTTTAWQDIALQTVEAVKEVAAFIRSQLGRVGSADILDKGTHSLVSYVDRRAEEMLVAGLQKITPDAVFLTEEQTVAPVAGELKWIIDPLDGTTNFLHGVPLFAISAGLEYQGRIVVGVVAELMREEYFWAWAGGGTFLNGKQVGVRRSERLFDACICIGLPADQGALYRDTLHLLSRLIPATRGVRNLGAAAVEIAYVACGRFDAFIELGLSPWDVAAGALLVQEAGGKVTDAAGGADYLYGGAFVATNGALHPEVLEQIRHGS